ncbi:hypothetical protein BAVI_05054 [Neobacillus vireti LMG 21834]|uniref:Uncharacterized protein n=1 Tax=Neobacillus vireti LMG 21834 TaxID=1131730 RepID=A0AB94ISD7_9BACI|nr:hypothetical protein BAVI_05054 [Neobacillus vireti LMG 21834]KLT18012.1 hypothetical protein AA980_10025 [Neobacillus vireti]
MPDSGACHAPNNVEFFDIIRVVTGTFFFILLEVGRKQNLGSLIVEQYCFKIFISMKSNGGKI